MGAGIHHRGALGGRSLWNYVASITCFVETDYSTAGSAQNGHSSVNGQNAGNGTSPEVADPPENGSASGK